MSNSVERVKTPIWYAIPISNQYAILLNIIYNIKYRQNYLTLFFKEAIMFFQVIQTVLGNSVYMCRPIWIHCFTNWFRVFALNTEHCLIFKLSILRIISAIPLYIETSSMLSITRTIITVHLIYKPSKNRSENRTIWNT